MLGTSVFKGPPSVRTTTTAAAALESGAAALAALREEVSVNDEALARLQQEVAIATAQHEARARAFRAHRLRLLEELQSVEAALGPLRRYYGSDECNTNTTSVGIDGGSMLNRSSGARHDSSYFPSSSSALAHLFSTSAAAAASMSPMALGVPPPPQHHQPQQPHAGGNFNSGGTTIQDLRAAAGALVSGRSAAPTVVHRHGRAYVAEEPHVRLLRTERAAKERALEAAGADVRGMCAAIAAVMHAGNNGDIKGNGGQHAPQHVFQSFNRGGAVAQPTSAAAEAVETATQLLALLADAMDTHGLRLGRAASADASACDDPLAELMQALVATTKPS